jgi:phenylacetate-CoA ligase
MFADIGFDPEQCLELSDLNRLPLTSENDLCQAYPYNMFATPLKEVVQIHTTTGRHPEPVVHGYTERDLSNASALMARILSRLGLGPEEVFQITLNYALGTGAFTFHEGARRLGAMVIPTATGRTQKQIMVMRDFGTTCLVATPSYALRLLHALREARISPAALRLKSLLLTGEPWPAGSRLELEAGFQARAYDLYGMSALFGPVVAAQCSKQSGLHLQEDLFYAEVLDPTTQRPVPDGQWGELVLTSLVKEAVPLLRYRTGDLVRRLPEDCACGSVFSSIDQLAGRVDDVLSVKGVNVSPRRIGQLLTDYLDQEILWRAAVIGTGPDQELVLRLGIREDLFFDQMKRQRHLVDRLRRYLAQWLGVTPKVLLVEPEGLD